MKTVGLDKDITVADEVRFLLRTTDESDYPLRPYRIDDVKIYFITREFTDSTVSEYSVEHSRQDLQTEYDRLRRELGIIKKRPVRLASTGQLDLSGLDEVDGVATQEFDRVLVKNQSDSRENGIYVASSGAWKRSSDTDSSQEVVSGIFAFVDEGVENSGTGWVLASSSKVSLGTTGLNFLKFAEEGQPSWPDEKTKIKAARLDVLEKQIAESKTKSSFFFKNAVPVKVFGGITDPDTGEFFPAWINPDMVPSEEREGVMSKNLLYEIEENGDPTGTFVLEWDPSGFREGDYFICWSWRPTLGDEVLSSHMLFSLDGSTSLTTSIPTHQTVDRKYEILMERYLPEMFKARVSESDLSPLVLKGLNESVARGFTLLENLVNQMIDLFDSNATHEQLLPLLSNLFNLKLRSNDPTLWRRQIKKAIPQFKNKGTISGLKAALADAGMRLVKLTRLWQVNSEYVYQEHFDYEGSENFSFSKGMILPPDQNFRIWIRHPEGQWIDLSPQSSSSSSSGWYESYVDDLTNNGFKWVGPSLLEGDSIRVMYKIKNMTSHQQAKENHIRILPLMDDRDERSQKHPIKNWNVRLIEEDDPMFETIVQEKHPISDPTIWGKIRTEFPYSENAYNMDEYNGSKRDSINPCDIDSDFVDNCSGCQSSKFNIDVEVEKLSNESLDEAKKVAEEYMPFHALIGTFNLYGSMNEFIMPSVERIEALVSYSREDVVLAGEGQHIFNRVVSPEELDRVKREVLASFTPVGDWGGVLKNQYMSLFPRSTSNELSINSGRSGLSHGFDAINVNTTNVSNSNPFENDNMVEIMGSTTARFSISNMSRNSARIYGSVNESLVGPVHEYRISNKIVDAINISVEQSDRVIFSDQDVDFTMFPIVTQNDVDLELSSEDVWILNLEGTQHAVQDVLPDGTLLLNPVSGPSSSSSSSGNYSWSLFDSVSEIKSGTNGVATSYSYGLATATSVSGDIRDLIKIGDYVYEGLDFWRVRSFKKGETDKFFLEGYDEGNKPINATVYRRVLENKVGQIGYEGIVLDAGMDMDMGQELGISETISENIKENFLVFIGSEGMGNLRRYTIIDVNGNELVLGGPMDDYTIDGQEVTFTVYKFSKENLTLSERTLPVVPGHSFNSIDRSGGVLITQSGGGSSLNFLSALLNSAQAGQPMDILEQSESISFNIEHRE